MKRYFKNASVKIQLFYPIFIGFLIAVVLITVLLVDKSRSSISTLAQNSLELEVATIKKMFERERELKLQKVQVDLKVAHELFYRHKLKLSRQQIQLEAVNQISKKKHQVSIPILKLNKETIYKSISFTDKTNKLFGGTTTIFQKIDSGYLRISTNVLKKDGERAVGTFIPNNSPVIQTIEQGKTYFGRAYVVNDWYITAYEPIYLNNEIIGILYVGDKEKDVDKLIEIIHTLKIGESGYVFVFDESGHIIIDHNKSHQKWSNEGVIQIVMNNPESISSFRDKENKRSILVASTFYNDFNFYIAAMVPADELTALPIRNIIIRAIFIGILGTIIFVFIILMTTTRRVHRLLDSIEQSGVELQSAKKALEVTEENFKTLFNNSTDEIIVSDLDGKVLEVNQVLCDDLGYSKSELLEMNIRDFKPMKFRYHVNVNRDETIKKGKYTFESENLTKDGKIIPVEIKSRLFEYKGQKAILSISRTISKRKELERKILSAVIKTEEKERERFSKDMHDGLGPLLSTIKLYVNEVNAKETTNEERDQFTKQINEMLDQAVSSTREISNNLMPRVIHEYGLVKALESFAQKVNQIKKLNIRFKHSGIDKTVDADIQLILFRVITELITNTIKHAQARSIDIHLKKQEDHISMVFEDDGIGFDVDEVMNNAKTGIGLKSIISRVKSVNGRCLITSDEDKGFKIHIDI